MPSLFCFSRKVTSKNLPLVSCFVKSNFCWQSAEIRLPYHLDSIYAKWLALRKFWVNRYLDLVRKWSIENLQLIRDTMKFVAQIVSDLIRQKYKFTVIRSSFPMDCRMTKLKALHKNTSKIDPTKFCAILLFPAAWRATILLSTRLLIKNCYVWSSFPLVQ